MYEYILTVLSMLKPFDNDIVTISIIAEYDMKFTLMFRKDAWLE